MPKGSHNKASWEQQAGQADAMRWRAYVVWHAQVLPMLVAAEAKYLIAEEARGGACPRMYDTYEQELINLRRQFSVDA